MNLSDSLFINTATVYGEPDTREEDSMRVARRTGRARGQAPEGEIRADKALLRLEPLEARLLEDLLRVLRGVSGLHGLSVSAPRTKSELGPRFEADAKASGVHRSSIRCSKFLDPSEYSIEDVRGTPRDLPPCVRGGDGAVSEVSSKFDESHQVSLDACTCAYRAADRGLYGSECDRVIIFLFTLIKTMENTTKFVVVICLVAFIAVGMAVFVFTKKQSDVNQRARTRRWGVAPLDLKQRAAGGRMWPPPTEKTYQNQF